MKQSLLHIIYTIICWILKPIISNRIFFINTILLLISPTLINAYFINADEYISISNSRFIFITVNNGASFPYILFIPFLVAYLNSTISIILSHQHKLLNRVFKICIYSINIVLFSVNIFLLSHFKTMISPTIIVLLHETTTNETKEFLQFYLINSKTLLSLFLTIGTIIYIYYSEKHNKSNIKNKFAVVLILIFSCYFFQRCIKPIISFSKLFCCKNLSEIEYWYNDFRPDTNILTNVIYSIYTIHISKIEMSKAINKTLTAPSDIIATNNVNIILVIGESYNKHHASIYNYPLKTTPYLEKERKTGNLLIYNDVITPYNMTSFVLRNLFSVNSIMNNENWSSFPAFPILFKNAGYQVYIWDNQRTFSKADISDFSISSYLYNEKIAKSSYTMFNTKTYQYDYDLISSFFKMNKLTSQRNLVIFHLMGQHAKASGRYPHNTTFNHFNNDSITNKKWLSKTDKNKIAEYDNATLYNDFIIHTIIDHFRNDTAVIVYISDHGEEVYDYRDVCGRTQEKQKTADALKYQYEIPFIIWCSDKYKSQYPEKIKNMVSAQNKPFMNDNICQILFNIAGIVTYYYHSERDLISPYYRPYNYRRVQDRIYYEEVIKKIHNKESIK